LNILRGKAAFDFDPSFPVMDCWYVVE